MKRRDFVKFGGIAALELGAARFLTAQAPTGMQSNMAAPEAGKADFTLRIAPVAVDVMPTHVVSTTGYNGTSPGPVLRMREDAPVIVDVDRKSVV